MRSHSGPLKYGSSAATDGGPQRTPLSLGAQRAVHTGGRQCTPITPESPFCPGTERGGPDLTGDAVGR
jgi:hypothetical protein